MTKEIGESLNQVHMHFTTDNTPEFTREDKEVLVAFAGSVLESVAPETNLDTPVMVAALKKVTETIEAAMEEEEKEVAEHFKEAFDRCVGARVVKVYRKDRGI